VIAATIVIIMMIGLMSVALTIVEFRKMKSLVFRCQRCQAEFRQPPHQDFPSRCPACHATDWNVG
jgi:hypothetical protein